MSGFFLTFQSQAVFSGLHGVQARIKMHCAVRAGLSAALHIHVICIAAHQ